MRKPDSGIRTKNEADAEELELLARVRLGDRQAFSDLYWMYQPRLYAYLRRILSDPNGVEEVLDDVMFVVWKDAARFRGDARLSTWIFGIAYRKALNAIRSERRYQAPLDRNADIAHLAGPANDEKEWIAAALAHLSPDHRQVMELTYTSGFSYQEIAEIAGCPVNTVKTRMFHARRRLRMLLPQMAGENEEDDRERA